MTDQDNDKPALEESVHEATGDESPHPRGHSSRGSALWFISPIIAVIVLAGAVAGWLYYSGIDPAWIAGTSGWVAPPGSKLAGKPIGGKSYDEIAHALDGFSTDFANLSVWLVEESVASSVVENEFAVSTVGDDIVLSVAPVEFGLSIDLDSLQNELTSLHEKSEDILAVGERIRLWNSPPEIPLKLSVDEDAAGEYMSGVKSTVDCEPVDAVLDLASRTVRAARDGIEVDIESTLEGIPEIIPQISDITLGLVLERTPPEITNDAFADIDLENPLGAYTTHFSIWKRNRSRNIEMVASHFEGVVIQPGEVLSFDEVTGPRTSAQGYYLAPMYIRSRIELSPAGGACQVSTTLYNAALLAGLEIVEREPHSRPCSYVPYGRDATVAWGAVDLKFRNDLDHPIILHQEVDRTSAGTITFEIFGHPDDRVYVEIGNAYSWIGRTESMTTYIVDTSLAPGEEVVEDSGTSGIHQRAWRIWYDEDGNELYTEELNIDVIRPVGALIRHNPSPGQVFERSEPQDEPDENVPHGVF